MRIRTTTSLGLSVLAVASFAAATAAPAAATDSSRTVTRAHVDSLNNSGAHGTTTVVVRADGKLNVTAKIHGLKPDNVPHAQHIHFGETARHECPTFRDDTNNDFRLNTVEGQPAYGPIRVSLTTSGDTSPASGLAVDRMPVARDLGSTHSLMNAIDYSRSGISTQSDVRAGIRDGEAVYVIHGIDYNKNGRYDFNGAGKSELDPALPAEATDPAACGVLRVQ